MTKSWQTSRIEWMNSWRQSPIEDNFNEMKLIRVHEAKGLIRVHEAKGQWDWKYIRMAQTG
jgi:hypothetical protein